jgi:hypothetical protein
MPGFSRGSSFAPVLRMLRPQEGQRIKTRFSSANQMNKSTAGRLLEGGGPWEIRSVVQNAG